MASLAQTVPISDSWGVIAALFVFVGVMFTALTTAYKMVGDTHKTQSANYREDLRLCRDESKQTIDKAYQLTASVDNIRLAIVTGLVEEVKSNREEIKGNSRRMEAVERALQELRNRPIHPAGD